MESSPQFNVYVKRDIPYLTRLLWWIVLIFMLGLGLFYLIMAPTHRSPDEMSTAYYILFVPDSIKSIAWYSLLGLLIFFPLYNAAKHSIPAIFSFNEEYIYIKGDKINIALPRRSIRDIYFNDLYNLWTKRSKEKIQVVFKQKTRHMTSFYLADYAEGDRLFEVISGLKTGKLSFYENSFDTNEED